MRKQGRKLESLINKKPPKLNDKTRKKTDHFVALQEVKNLQNLAKKNREENQILIKNRDKFFLEVLD